VDSDFMRDAGGELASEQVFGLHQGSCAVRSRRVEATIPAFVRTCPKAGVSRSDHADRQGLHEFDLPT